MISASRSWLRVLALGVLVISTRGYAVETATRDESFVLHAGPQDLHQYFPTLLGNGYIATMSGPRGTEPTPVYMAGLMDYTAGDMSRPANVPNWTEVDFSPYPPGPKQAWINRVPLSERHFRDYHQTLDLHGATLTTSYRYVDGQRATGVETVTFVSQATPHLAATRFKITPEFDGLVQISFALRLWAQHAPRFPLARMTGPQMEEAVEANGLSLQPRPPATPDREAVWYPGYVQVATNDGDSASLSLWLDGRAAEGLPMGMAAALDIPAGVKPETVTVYRDQYRLSLDVTLQVERGRSYEFTKFIALSRSGWGGDAQADLALARQARTRGFDELLKEHTAAWSRLWRADITIEGDARAQQVVHSELYYLLASSTPDTGWALGACSLTPGYAGHVFWDNDTWIFPALLLLHPERAKSLVSFRERTLEPARQRAHERGFAGAMYPWESDPENGTEQTPHSAYILGESEIHVTAEVAIAQWQYYLATGDLPWLRQHGWPVIREIARFWGSRAHYDEPRSRYEIIHVNSVAESNNDIPNDTFTNLAARTALSIAIRAARLVGEAPDPVWARIVRTLYVPMDPSGQHHLPFDPAIAANSEDFGGGPVALLFLPSLDLDLQEPLLRGDYEYAVRPTPAERVARVSMGIAPRAIAADMVHDVDDASAYFADNFSGGTLKPPFNVRLESANNNTGYFLTGSGGYVQSLIFGFSGLRLRPQGLVEAYAPVLPKGWSSLTLRNLQLRGEHLDIRIARDSTGVVRLTRQVH